MAALAEIVTPRLRIVPFEERHLTDRYVAWLNDPEIVRYSEQRYHRHDRDSCRAYCEGMRRSGNYFSAIEADSNTHIGNISVAVDAANGLADISILLDKQVWGVGYGLETWSAVMAALLHREGFRKVTGGAVASNRAMIKIMESAGMEPDGRRRAHYIIDGSAVDVVYYAAFHDRRGN